MGGIFGFFDYSKPGPGVEKDEPAKSPIKIFFEVLQRKFWSLLKVNILFMVFNLPALVLFLFLSPMLFQIEGLNQEITGSVTLSQLVLGVIFLCVPVITVGPSQAGMTYILRNYAREEHAFIWWDFKEAALKNFKQSLIIGLIDIFVFAVMSICLNFYMSYNKGGILISIAFVMNLLTFIIFIMMHIYIYPMLVTFQLSIFQIYKNAVIFAVAKFLPNLGILILIFGILMATFIYPVIGTALFFLITVSVIGLITNFYAYSTIKKYMLDKFEVQEENKKQIN